jgi:hypothetical protein
LIIFVSVFLTQNAAAENFIYHNSENHFSFKIPDGWTETPKNVLDASIRALEYQANQSKMALPNIQRPIVIFQPKHQPINQPSVSFPYFEVGVGREGKISKDEFKKLFASEEATELVMNKGVSDALKRIPPEIAINNLVIGKPIFDGKRDILFSKSGLSVAGFGEVISLNAGFLSNEGITRLTFYALKADYQKYVVDFSEVIDSFKLDSGYEYTAQADTRTGTAKIKSITYYSGLNKTDYTISIGNLTITAEKSGKPCKGFLAKDVVQVEYDAIIITLKRNGDLCRLEITSQF